MSSSAQDSQEIERLLSGDSVEAGIEETEKRLSGGELDLDENQRKLYLAYHAARKKYNEEASFPEEENRLFDDKKLADYETVEEAITAVRKQMWGDPGLLDSQELAEKRARQAGKYLKKLEKSLQDRNLDEVVEPYPENSPQN